MLMLSHGIVSPALFLCVGVLYDRYKTRLCRYYGGCVNTMPIFCILFCLFTMANIALPLTAYFVGELLIFQGVFCNNTLVAFLSATSMICSGGYSLLAYGRVAYGSCKPYYIRSFSDLSRREFFMFIPFGAAVRLAWELNKLNRCVSGWPNLSFLKVDVHCARYPITGSLQP